jgi:hypothetical protein
MHGVGARTRPGSVEFVEGGHLGQVPLRGVAIVAKPNPDQARRLHGILVPLMAGQMHRVRRRQWVDRVGDDATAGLECLPESREETRKGLRGLVRAQRVAHDEDRTVA